MKKVANRMGLRLFILFSLVELLQLADVVAQT